MRLGAPRLELFIAGSALSHLRYQRFVERVIADSEDEVAFAVTDVVADPARADEHGIVATPQLVRWHPTPVRRIIGEIFDEHALRDHLEVIPAAQEDPDA